MATDQQRQVVTDVKQSLKALNVALREASRLGVRVSFVNVSTIGEVNDQILLGECRAEERVTPL